MSSRFHKIETRKFFRMAFIPFKARGFILLVLVQYGLAVQAGLIVGESSRPESVNRQVDYTQAEMMLNLLRSSVAGTLDPQMIEPLLDTRGTALIVSQQNISRIVTREQYKTLLSAVAGEQSPDIAPVDGTERSRRGVEGLRKDVWPALHWGRTHTTLLAQRIDEIKRFDLCLTSVALASRFLPERVPLAPHLYVVMGGRAGAAALAGDEIYFDVLAMSYRAENGASRYPSPAQISEYFAHEIHHLGLSQIIERTRLSLRLSKPQERAFSFLTAVVMEGAASYLINAHRNLDLMRNDPEFAANLSKSDELLKVTEQVLRSVLESNLDGEAYDKATSPFLGSGWHSVGATMLAAIDHTGGLQAIMQVLRDPRKLLVAYNRAMAKPKTKSNLPIFNSQLAQRISRLGK